MKRLISRALQGMGIERVAWHWNDPSLRILCYHGLCEDRLAAQAWMPGFFVTASAFRRQLEYLKKTAAVLPLSEAVVRMQNGSLPRRAVSITFDDGYANNLHLAAPLLAEYALPATVFLSSAYMESGELFPFLKVKLIQSKIGRELPPAALPEYKTAPIDQLLEAAGRWWPRVKDTLSQAQIDTLRPLTVAEVRALDGALIELGAHSHTHCILRNETRERREMEILTSIAKVGEWAGRPARLFSYPNGQRDDFAASDKEVLKRRRIQCAVSGISGTNGAAADLLELRRYPVGLYHDETAFRAELTGFRTAWRTLTGESTR